MASKCIVLLVLHYGGIHAVQLSPQPITSFLVQQGQRVILPFNYSVDLSERDKVLTVGLDLNGDAVLTYVEFKGGIIENRTVGAFIGRRDMKLLSSPQTYVGFVIEQTTLNDTGRYTWSITIDATETPGVPLEVIVGNKPGSVSLVYSHEEGMTYRLACTVMGGIPSPNMTILNGTEVIHTSSASTTTTNVTVDFTTVFYCVGTNGLGSMNSSSLQLPIPTTTMSPTTSPVTTTGDNTAPITSTSTDKSYTGNNTANAPWSPGNSRNTGLIVGVICGGVGGIFIIVILVYVFRKKGHKTKPGKKGLTLEQRVVQGNANTREQQENTTTPSTQVQRPENASKLSFIRFINRFRKGTTDDNHTYEVPERIEENQQYTLIALNESSQELNLNDIELLQNVGHGHFGEVFKAILKTTNAAVAVKLLKEQCTEVEKRDFFREIETMRLVPQHENVVAMLGFCKTAARAFLVLEYLGNGNLKTYLRKNRSNNIYGNLHGGSGKLSSQNLLVFALDSAKGMAHIARYKFLHRDLAARNILVSDDMVCKVSDFGLARDVIDSREYLSRMETPLPIRWMAPESISDSVYTTKSDVWSFGVLLWEIVTLGATPYPGITSGRELIHEIRSGYRMEKPQHCTQELYNMMMKCWEEEPTERPTFDNLVTSLRGMANEEMKLHVDVDRAAEAIYCDIDSQLVGEIV